MSGIVASVAPAANIIPVLLGGLHGVEYRNYVADPGQLVVVNSQFGQPSDTPAALRQAMRLGYHRMLAICDLPESPIVRECALRVITSTGKEIGVASIRAFSTQLAALFVLTQIFGKLCSPLDVQSGRFHRACLRHLLAAVARMLDVAPSIQDWVQNITCRTHALFFGHGHFWPIMRGGARKLKDMSYIYAEEISAGEFKHNPPDLVQAVS